MMISLKEEEFFTEDFVKYIKFTYLLKSFYTAKKCLNISLKTVVGFYSSSHSYTCGPPQHKALHLTRLPTLAIKFAYCEGKSVEVAVGKLIHNQC